jgi:DNA-binding MarR family transcriptional regulator
MSNTQLNRKQKIEELLVDLQLLKRTMMFRMSESVKIPRITPSQWGVLMFIGQCGKSTVKDVAKALGITSSAATQLVDGLVTSEYLTKETYAEDRRIAVLILSKKSKKQVERMKKHALQGFLKLFEVLNDEEFNQYSGLNKKIAQRLLSHKVL